MHAHFDAAAGWTFAAKYTCKTSLELRVSFLRSSLFPRWFPIPHFPPASTRFERVLELSEFFVDLSPCLEPRVLSG
ncbi:hypothetical protein MPTK1_6g13220 [Marchantia polymorpha subsp. ruderalis]